MPHVPVGLTRRLNHNVSYFNLYQLSSWLAQSSIGSKPVQVDHFVRFADDERAMPVVWHQTLLCFVQRYKVGNPVAKVQCMHVNYRTCLVTN